MMTGTVYMEDGGHWNDTDIGLRQFWGKEQW